MTRWESIQTLNPEKIFPNLPANRFGKADRKYLEEVLEDGFGNRESANMIGRFEGAFAQKFESEFAISMNSGSGTMVACLLAAGIGPGDEVLVPSLTMAATAFVVIQVGAVPVFVDSYPDTFCMDMEDARQKISPFTKAIIPVSIFGLAPDFEKVLVLAEEFNLVVIEDDAQTFLGYYHNKLVGTFGQASSFSFQGSKHMTSGGDGGMVVTNDEDLAIKIRKAAIQGYRTLEAKPGSTMIPRDERQDWSFHRHDTMGYNFRMSAVQAALGLGQLERLDQLVEARRCIAGLYKKAIYDEKCDWLHPPFVPDDIDHTYWCYPVLLDEKMLGVDWRTFRKKFIEYGGDGLYGCYTPVHLEPIFQTLTFYGNPSRAPHFDPRYRGTVKKYTVEDCPVLETIRRRLCLFKTGMQSLDKVYRQVESLVEVIRYYH